MKNNARQLAFETLLKIEHDGAYSNLVLDKALNTSNLDTRDKSFVSGLVYGVTERKLTIDYQLSKYLSKPLKKLKPEVLIILRMGVCQLLFMEKIPPSAAVNESVKLTKANKSAYASSLVNAVLRKTAANGLLLPPESNYEEFLSIKYSCPLWLVEKWINEYGAVNILGLLSSSIGATETVIRVNTVKTTAEKLKKQLSDENIDCKDGYIENTLIISLSGVGIERLNSYKKGLFHVQDTACCLCAEALQAKKGETFFDLCSAPGGKTFTVAEIMQNEGKVLAFDIYPKRAKLINDGAKRLGLDIIKAETGDASKFNPKLGFADKVLCDVPCSGLGIIGRKPEIKYKSEESINELPDLQLKILLNGAKYVKRGGRLVYSTCTLNKAENENVCERFIEANSEFKAVKPLEKISEENFVSLMPHINHTDGFFVAAFERKES